MDGLLAMFSGHRRGRPDTARTASLVNVDFIERYLEEERWISDIGYLINP
jgi:hypothetical protein